jgi:hypothetical protein
VGEEEAEDEEAVDEVESREMLFELLALAAPLV